MAATPKPRAATKAPKAATAPRKRSAVTRKAPVDTPTPAPAHEPRLVTWALMPVCVTLAAVLVPVNWLLNTRKSR